jgi:hypothetical protein
MYDVHVCDCFIINVLDSDQDQTDQSDDEAFTPSEHVPIAYSRFELV